MKKTGTKATYYAKGIENIATSLSMARSVFAVKENFPADISQLLESQHELEIIYANIRV